MEMQIKIILRYHYIPIRIATMKEGKTQQYQLLIRIQNWNCYTLMVEQNGTAILFLNNW